MLMPRGGRTVASVYVALGGILAMSGIFSTTYYWKHRVFVDAGFAWQMTRSLG